jgi:hypothetical protein
LDGSDPDWPERDVELLTAYERWRRAELCPLCGWPKSVCRDPATEVSLDVGEPVRCHVTTAIRDAHAAFAAKPGVRQPGAVMWDARLRNQ